MEIVRRIFRFYINSSIHVALAVVSFTEISRLHLQIPPNPSLLLFIFLGTITGYNFVKYARLAGLKHRRLTRGLREIQLFSFFCFLGLLYVAFQMRIELMLLAVLLALLNLLYALPLFKKKNLRAIGGIKVYVISIIWAGVSVLFPVIDMGLSLDKEGLFLLGQRFLYVLVLLVPFEIRDLKTDPPELRTFPQKYGVKRSKLLGLGLLLGVAGANLFKEVSPEVLMVDFLVYSFTAGMVLFASQDRHPYYTTFWVEGIPIAWLFLLWVAQF